MVSTRFSIPGYHISEEIYNGSRTLVYRGYRETDSLPVVMKLLKNRYSSFSELVQFRNQYTITKNLNSPLIIKTYSLEVYQNGYALVMEDFGGISLKEWMPKQGTATSIIEFFRIAIALCNALDILYREQIIHKDIKPANILINPQTKQIKLIDFSIASLLPRETQTLISPNVLEGTLTYLSPEQTGRMNRAIDYRSDFYSLGVTFYELLTGELPFPSNDLMELIHCHLAKLPPCLQEVKSEEIPQVLCNIVMKLMAKNAEDRYQSALGLKFDLENCLTQLQATGKIGHFEIAQRDVCDRFTIPDKLYGRETEVSILLKAFERVSLGATEMMLVAGFSGIGKTVVVNEVHKPIVRQRGYFIKGKYDQFQRNIPLSAFVQAFRNLMGQLLTESDAQIQQWKIKILSAVGENGQVIIEVIPELLRIIGQQPPAIELSGTAAQNRFNLLFQRFTQVFTSAEHPLVIFLDDLQWSDSASLNLMQLLMADTKYLFLIGAYRDNEVNSAHPFMLTLNEIQKTAATINTITLAPLSQGQVNQLVADTLKCTENLALPFSQLIAQKTQGNPFFATQFLLALHQDRFIQFNFESGFWQCDIAQVSQQALTDDVVAFMALQLLRLPESTQQVLQLAACIGNEFDLATLAIVSEKSEIETAANLWKALQEGLILPISEIYKFYQGEDNDNLANGNTSKQLAKYKFLHDRVQQAAYSLIPEHQKQATHLKIGQLLLENLSVVEQEEKLFDIVRHLNQGKELITQPRERQALAQLNFKAGGKAKTSTTYTSAADYLKTGIELISSEGWKDYYEVTLALHRQLAEVEFLCGHFDETINLVKLVITHAQKILEQAEIYNLLVVQYTFLGNYTEAIATGLKALSLLGIDIPRNGDALQTAIQSEIQTINNYLQNRSILSLLEDLSQTTEPKIRVAIQLLVNLDPPIYITSDLDLYILVSAKIVAISLQYGYIPETVKGFGNYGWLSGIVLGDYKSGYEFGLLGMSLAHKLNNSAQLSKVSLSFGSWISIWSKPIWEIADVNDIGYRAGLESGEILFGGYNLFCKVANLLFQGTNLDILDENLNRYLPFALKTENQLLFGILGGIYFLVQQLFLSKYDLSDAKYNSGKIQLDEQKYLERCRGANDVFSLNIYYICQMQLCCIYQNFLLGFEYAQAAEKTLNGSLGFTTASEYPIYKSLILLNLYKEATLEQQVKYLQQVQHHQRQYKIWVDNCSENFLHKYLLVEAELNRVTGEKLKAMDLYDFAIASAKENHFLHIEALSNELAAKFYLDWGKEKIAQVYMHQAYYCYAHWGAEAKVNHLEKTYPQLLEPILQQQQSNFNSLETLAFHRTSSSTRTNSTSLSDVLDFTSGLKAAQAISTSLELDQLIASLTRIILENSGASKAVLLLPQDDTWQVRAITFVDYEEIQTILEPQLLDSCQDIPIKIIHYVKNTQQTVVIDNCKTDIPGVIGEYMYRTQPQSVFCTPMINQGHLVGILYLENSLTPGVFTSDRKSVINLLCTQAAISLENAQLYTHLEYSQARFHRLAENVPGMIYQFQLSEDGISKLNYASSGCDEIYGISSEQAVADTSSLISTTHPEDMARYQESITISAQSLEPWRYEGRIITPSGEVKWIQAASRPIKQADGTIIWDGLVLDVTERKLAEAVVIQKSQELQKALEELQQAQLQIVQSEKMSALGNLVAGVAHEMNNPLGFIAASLKQAKPTITDIVEHLRLYQQSFSDPGDQINNNAVEIDLDYILEDLPKMIDSMTMACDRLKNISTSLRTFSRADKDYKVPFNIHDGINSTILILKHRLKANELRPAIEVITEYGNLPQIECFPGQLNQVFMNILANAIDALEESNTGRTFTEIQANPNRITIKTSVKNSGVKITIADNGSGMREEVKQKLFDHLFTTKAVGKGTGLGLAIARQIVESTHSGKLTFHSIFGEGTEFFLEIPI